MNKVIWCSQARPSETQYSCTVSLTPTPDSRQELTMTQWFILVPQETNDFLGYRICEDKVGSSMRVVGYTERQEFDKKDEQGGVWSRETFWRVYICQLGLTSKRAGKLTLVTLQCIDRLKEATGSIFVEKGDKVVCQGSFFPSKNGLNFSHSFQSHHQTDNIPPFRWAYRANAVYYP